MSNNPVESSQTADQLNAPGQRLSDRLVAFAWEEWAQMGLLATPHRRSPWAQDPEALIVFTLSSSGSSLPAL
jgi:hypothetical protein